VHLSGYHGILGWRSWNFFACEIDAGVFERQVDALVDRSRTVNGKPTSLADLGYSTFVGCATDCPSRLDVCAMLHPPTCLSGSMLVGVLSLPVECMLPATVGIDDCWQDCMSSTSLNGSYHTVDGKPIVDESRFPGGLRQLTDKAAAKGIQMGWCKFQGRIIRI
jgi:hypothetical protein